MNANQNRHDALNFLQVANKFDNLLTSEYILLNTKWSLLIKLNGGV